jgi:hypothetical protein
MLFMNLKWVDFSHYSGLFYAVSIFSFTKKRMIQHNNDKEAKTPQANEKLPVVSTINPTSGDINAAPINNRD